MSSLGDAVTLDALDDDPYPLLAQLREREPVAWAPALGRWLVTSRALVVDLIKDTDAFTTASDASLVRSTFGPQMLSTDGDEQKRHRGPFAASFRPRAVRSAYGGAIFERCNRLIDELQSGDDDLAVFAARLAITTVMDVLGLEAADPAIVRGWYDDLAAGLANVRRDRDVAERARATAETVRAHVGRVPENIDLDDRAFGSNVLLMLFGGIETAESMIVNAVWTLLAHPDALGAVRVDPGLTANAVEESLRFEAAVQTLTRFATRDVQLAGVTIRAGDVVEGMIGGANRDPSHFADPDRVDVARRNARDHLTFGAGRHTCIGIHLARLEAEIAVRTLLDRLPALRLDPERPSRPRGHEFRKVRPLPVVWG